MKGKLSRVVLAVLIVLWPAAMVTEPHGGKLRLSARRYPASRPACCRAGRSRGTGGAARRKAGVRLRARHGIDRIDQHDLPLSG